MSSDSILSFVASDSHAVIQEFVNIAEDEANNRFS